MSKKRQESKRVVNEVLRKVQSGMTLDELYDEQDDLLLQEKDDGSIESLMEMDLEEPEEPKEKMSGYVEEYAGPTDFDELDKLRNEQEKAEKIRRVTWDTEHIVMNIVRSPVLSADEKEKKIAKAGKDMKTRLSSAMKPEKKEFDYDLAHTEMLLALEDGGIISTVQDWVNKTLLTQGAKEKLSDDDFALVVEHDGEKVRRFPVHDRSHVRNALAKVAKMIEQGGEGAIEARKALPKIREAAKTFGIGQPSEKNTNGLIVEKDESGDLRFVGWLSGKWIDRDGDILSDSAHKEFIDYLEANDDWKIVFRSWHTPGTEREHEIDFWTYKNGFVLVSGKLTQPEAERLMTAMKEQKIGMSHGFFAARDKDDSRVIRKYRTFEVSDLPLDKAAFPWSDIPEIMEVSSMNTKLDYLSTVVDKERLAKILEDAELKENFLQNSGIEAKSLESFLSGEEAEEEVAEKETEEQEEKSQALTPEIVELLKKELGLEDVFDFVEKAEAAFALIPLLQKQIEEQDAELEEKQKDVQEQLADFLNSGNSTRSKALASRASESEDNIADEEEVEKAGGPQHENWLAEVAGVTVE